GGRRIRNLAEIRPERHICPLQILIHHRHDTDGEVSRYTAGYLKEAYSFTVGVSAVPFCKIDHIFNPRLYGAGFQVTLNHIRRKDISGRGVFPSRTDD